MSIPMMASVIELLFEESTILTILLKITKRVLYEKFHRRTKYVPRGLS
jgi:hypothetical protein